MSRSYNPRLIRSWPYMSGVVRNGFTNTYLDWLRRWFLAFGLDQCNYGTSISKVTSCSQKNTSSAVRGWSLGLPRLCLRQLTTPLRMARNSAREVRPVICVCLMLTRLSRRFVEQSSSPFSANGDE